MTRSKPSPIVPESAIAASTATATTPRFDATLGAVAAPPIAAKIVVARNAPSAMNRLWPKLRTSISPKTSVSPDAAMKTIIPIARPAMVSVSQVDEEPTTGHATSAIAASRTTGQ